MRIATVATVAVILGAVLFAQAYAGAVIVLTMAETAQTIAARNEQAEHHEHRTKPQPAERKEQR